MSKFHRFLLILCSAVFSWTALGVVAAHAQTVTATVLAGTGPSSVAVNPVTNKIYVANLGSNTVTVINGANNTTTPVSVGRSPTSIAVNAVTNKIYVGNLNGGTVTVISGADSSTTAVNVGSTPF